MMYDKLISTYEKKGIPLHELLDYLRINETTYYNWANYGNIPASSLVKLAEKLECSVDCLLGVENDNVS